jgi:hypothetical protein
LINVMRITSDVRVRDVLEHHPGTAEIFIQDGSFVRNTPGSLYAAYDGDLTVGSFAARSGVDAGRLLSRLNATAESDEWLPPRSQSRLAEEKTVQRVDEAAGGHDAARDVGYTGGYRDPAKVEARPVVAVQTARGPD